MVYVGPCLTYHDPESGIRNYGSRTTGPDYESVLRIRITDNRSRLRNTDQDHFGNHKMEMDQGLPQFYTDNFSCDDRTNDASPRIFDKMYFGRSAGM